MAAVLATIMGGARSFPAVFPQILLHVTPGQDEGSTRPTPDENTAATHAPHLIRSLLLRCPYLLYEARLTSRS